jgi:23S rRNA (adenine2030-N6)-methyltransferase
MNYRHAFHAGNHTEVFKHSALVMLLEHLTQKPQAFMVLDTHAGTGVYDLESEAARRTGEMEGGIGRFRDGHLAVCPRYLELVRSLNPAGLRYYPGSPEIVRMMLRGGDRLIACELHPEDCDELAGRYRPDRRVLVRHLDGYEAVNALLPPAERRGLVFIDPPFERRDEADAMAAAMKKGLRKWATGIFCLWYPVKDSAIGDFLAETVRERGYPKALRVELLPFRKDGASLAGSGIILVNTPWKFAERAERLCRELVSRLGDGAGTWSIDRLTGEG